MPCGDNFIWGPEEAVRNVYHDQSIADRILAQPLNARVPPGARRYFAVSLPDPPAAARELDVAFDPKARPKARKAGARAAAPPPAAAPRHGPEPVEAVPLSPDSPHALTPHE